MNEPTVGIVASTHGFRAFMQRKAGNLERFHEGQGFVHEGVRYVPIGMPQDIYGREFASVELHYGGDPHLYYLAQTRVRPKTAVDLSARRPQPEEWYIVWKGGMPEWEGATRPKGALPYWAFVSRAKYDHLAQELALLKATIAENSNE